MTKAEVAQLLVVLAEAYPRFEVSDTTVEVWWEMVCDIDMDTARAAVKKCIMTGTWAPSIAEVRKAAAEISGPQRPSGVEAWGLLVRAIAAYGYYRQDEALQSLPGDVAQVARWMGWQELCHSTNADVIRGQFCKLFDTHTQREAELKALPAAMREQLAALGERMALPQGEEDRTNGRAQEMLKLR